MTRLLALPLLLLLLLLLILLLVFPWLSIPTLVEWEFHWCVCSFLSVLFYSHTHYSSSPSLSTISSMLQS